jgi:ribosome biogenesis GTPase A
VLNKVMKPFKKLPKNTKIKKSQKEKIKITSSGPTNEFNWFPGHMLKAINEIQDKLAMVDLVLEIRDARVPTISSNGFLKASFKDKGRLVLLNKTNLADPLILKKWETWFKNQAEPYLFINCLEKSAINQVLIKAQKLIEEKRMICNPEGIPQKSQYRLMIIGLPNTGKSTFINQVANRHATKIADKPGQTRHQLWIKVDEKLQLLDTPGILPPEIKSEEHRLWLSAINAIPDEIVGEEDTAIYLIRYFMKIKSDAFFERFKLPSFDLGLDETLNHIATLRGCLRQKGLADLDRVYKIILSDFRQGYIGKVCFEAPPE